MKSERRAKTDIERGQLWEEVLKNYVKVPRDNTECWALRGRNYQSNKTLRGVKNNEYVKVSTGVGRAVRLVENAHALAAWKGTGRWKPAGEGTNHTCIHSRWCCNPDHVRWAPRQKT